MPSTLLKLASNGDISWLSYYFADFITDQSSDEPDSLLALSAALLSESNQQGNVCVDLNQFDDQPLFKSEQLEIHELPVGIEPGQWIDQLMQSLCVGGPGDSTPMILEDHRLYLNRFWRYENLVAEKIQTRFDFDIDIDEDRLIAELQRLFASPDGLDRDQKLAVALSACNPLSVISGGPGTGKTTTVIKILSVLLAQQPQMRIALAAPTGKAAARMMESIGLRIDTLEIESRLRSAIPTEASTIHRLLDYRWQKFRYNHNHRLPLDCVVVDEASMIDLTLMYRLLDALPDHARIILLGDRDQLSSVSAGNVLGDITGHGNPIIYSDSMRQKLERISGVKIETGEGQSLPVSNSIALLQENFRFQAAGSIGELSKLINQGSREDAIALLRSGDKSINWIETCEKMTVASLDTVLTSYRSVLQSASVSAALDAFEQARVLCAVNHGNFGVVETNRFIEKQLGVGSGRASPDNYPGQPLLINRNDYDLELFNGDTGIVWSDENNRLQAWFRASDSSLRQFPLHRIPNHTTAWAMTVHKSQGSEFNQVAIILPVDEKSMALTRELLYTGITRAKNRVSICASEKVICKAIQQITLRSSGLAKKLGWPNP